MTAACLIVLLGSAGLAFMGGEEAADRGLPPDDRAAAAIVVVYAICAAWVAVAQLAAVWKV